MTPQLREELARLGDEAPPPHVDVDTWARGRRVRRRARTATGAAALVVIASLGGAAAALVVDPERVGPASVPGDVGGVPEGIVLPPSGLVRGTDGQARWDERVVETDLAVGRGAAALEVYGEASWEGSVPMVVTADGRHHALELPGWQGSEEGRYVAGSTSRLLALSPDGERLAYAWRDDPDGYGVGVLDLSDGQVRPVPIPTDVVNVVTFVDWAPDSEWLVWCGAMDLTAETGVVDLACGRVGPDQRTTEVFPLPDAGLEGALSVGPGGRILQTKGRETWTWDGRPTGELRRDTPSGQLGVVAAHSPDGVTVLLGSSVSRSSALFLDARTSEITERPLGKDLDLYPEGAEVHPLGWVDETLAVALVTPQGDTTVDDEARLVLMTSPSVPEESWTYRIVGRVDTNEANAFAPASLSVAVDLMTLAEPTRDFPAPDWPWSPDRSLVLAAAIALAAALVALLLWWRRRPA